MMLIVLLKQLEKLVESLFSSERSAWLGFQEKLYLADDCRLKLSMTKLQLQSSSHYKAFMIKSFALYSKALIIDELNSLE